MPHLQALQNALQKERAALVAEHQALSALDLPAKVALGFSLSPLDIVTVELRSRDRVNVLLRGNHLHSGISAGDPILLAPVGRPDVGIKGRCEGVDESTVEVRVDEAPEGKGPWAVSRRLELTVLDLQMEALKKAERLKTPLAHLLLGLEKPYKSDPYEHPAFSRLNPSQRAAAELAMGATEIGLVHGPPGTGKTEVLVAILLALRERGEHPWALAESNAAVDLLARKAADAGLEVVRIGASARIGPAVAKLTLEHRILHGARATVIQKLLREAIRAEGEALREARAAIREEWSAAKKEVLENADLLAMTLGTLHTRGAQFPAPRTAVVDEASQLWEPAIWLLASRVKRIILAGDPQQLGPVVRSRDPLLEKSLLGRLVDGGFPFPMLQEQYRMNDALNLLSRDTYQGRVKTHPSVECLRLGDLGAVETPWGEVPAVFVDTAGVGYDEEGDRVGSFENPGELQLLQRIWRELREQGVKAENVGVVTPYQAQLQRIRAALPELESGTINAFQGREKEVILASFVRSNPQGETGFVADARRLNVTVTRARRLFIGVGDSSTLGRIPVYERLIGAIEKGGGYRSAWEMAE